MTDPAYAGVQFYFDIQVGLMWRHEFPIIDRGTGDAMDFDAGWAGECKIRDNGGLQLAHLTSAGGADGTVSFDTGIVALDLPADFTAGLQPTTSYAPGLPKPFVFADVVLTDPDNPGEPYILGRGKGVIYLPTTVTP